MTNNLYHEICAMIGKIVKVYKNSTCGLQDRANPLQPWGDMLFHLLQITSATGFHWRKRVHFDVLSVLWTFEI